MLEELQTAFATPASAVGHFTYGLLVVSMIMRNMTWLRIVAILSGLLAIFYRLYLVPDAVSVLWETAFVLVNVVQLAISWVQHMRARFSEEEAEFVQMIVPILPRALAHKLMRIGSWRNFAEGERLTSDGVVVPDLMFIVSGAALIEKNGQPVATCKRGDFVGEMSFITGAPASADVFASGEVRCLCFERSRLKRLLEKEPDIRSALDASFSRNLIDKLVSSNEGRFGPTSTAPSPA